MLEIAHVHVSRVEDHEAARGAPFEPAEPLGHLQVVLSAEVCFNHEDRGARSAP